MMIRGTDIGLAFSGAAAFRVLGLQEPFMLLDVRLCFQVFLKVAEETGVDADPDTDVSPEQPEPGEETQTGTSLCCTAPQRQNAVTALTAKQEKNVLLCFYWGCCSCFFHTLFSSKLYTGKLRFCRKRKRNLSISTVGTFTSKFLNLDLLKLPVTFMCRYHTAEQELGPLC